MPWTDLTYPFGSLLTSAKMTQNQDNFHALANADSGAPVLYPSVIYNPFNEETAVASVVYPSLALAVTSAWSLVQQAGVNSATDAFACQGRGQAAVSWGVYRFGGAITYGEIALYKNGVALATAPFSGNGPSFGVQVSSVVFDYTSGDTFQLYSKLTAPSSYSLIHTFYFNRPFNDAIYPKIS